MNEGDQRVVALLEGSGVVAVFGKRGSGKTTYCRWLARSVAKRKMVIDPLWQLREYPRFVYATSLSGFLLVADDAENFFGRGNDDEEKRRVARALIQRGRHADVSILASVRRPVELWPDFRSQMGVLVCFALTERRDLDFVSDIIGRDASELSRLQVGQYVTCFL